MSAVLLARELAGCGINVRALVLSDPVYRHGYRLGQWRAMVPWSRIKVPTNVAEVWWFRQKNPRFGFRSGSWWHPSGHELLVETEETIVHGPWILEREHDSMDDAEEFHETASQVAELI
jgi:hypothetical protein